MSGWPGASKQVARRGGDAMAMHTVTHFNLTRLETGKTGETNTASNNEFMREVFGEDLGNVRPVMVSFEGSPAMVPGKAWVGQPWSGAAEQDDDLPASANNYFSLAVFDPDEAGQYRRQKGRFHALYAVMLDDVGSKVAMDRLTLLPSWLLETSPNNFRRGICCANH